MQAASCIQLILGNVHWPVEISTAAENRAISSSVSCSEHKLLAKSKTALTKSSQPWRERTKKSTQEREIFLTHSFSLAWHSFEFSDWLFPWIYTKRKSIGSNVLPRALNICMPPYFPSKRTVLLRGLKARHIRTKTTSKQPGRTVETDCDDFEADIRTQDTATLSSNF